MKTSDLIDKECAAISSVIEAVNQVGLVGNADMMKAKIALRKAQRQLRRACEKLQEKGE